MTEQVKTGTTTVTLKYTDGVIVAADRRITLGHMISADMEKVVQVAPNTMVTIAGLVSDAQYFSRLIKSEIKLLKLKYGRDPTVKEVAQLLSAFMYSNARGSMFGGMTGFQVAGVDSAGVHIFNIGTDGSVINHPNHNTNGSGSIFVMGVFETDFKENMSESDAVRVVKKGLHAAIKKDSASGNGVDIYKITKNGVEKIEQVIVEENLPF